MVSPQVRTVARVIVKSIAESSLAFNEELLMLFDLFMKGSIIGFSIAAPVGPIGALCIRTTLTKGRVAGLCTGLGAAAADAVYGALAVAGISAVSSVLIGSSFWLHLLGGLFLCYLGCQTLRSPVSSLDRDQVLEEINGTTGFFKFFSSTFLLTLSNPMTIMCFSGVFASIGGLACSGIGAPLMVAGVFLGSCAWWLLLTAAVAAVKTKLSGRAVRWISCASAAVVIGFGVFAVATASNY